MKAQILVEALGWTLVHFLWQGVLAFLLLAVLLKLLKTASSRYLAATSVMALLLAVAALTFLSRADWNGGSFESVVVSVVPTEPASGSGEISSPVGDPVSERSVDGPGVIQNRQRSGNEVETNASPTVGDTSRTAPWLGWVVSGWLVGVLFFALRFCFDWKAVVSLRRSAEVLGAESEWSERFFVLAKRIGIARPVRLLSSAAVHVPVVLGVLRPVVIVPVAMLSNLPPAQVDALLLHELAHVRRHDFLINLLQSLVEAVFFFHPAVWWISGKIREERENCCDDLASASCGDVREYAGALAALEESRDKAVPALSLAADGRHSKGGNLVSRIRRLVRGEGASASASGAWPVASIAALVLACVGALGALVWITEGRADDGAKPKWEDMQVSHFGGDGREIFCIHTDKVIQTVVVVSRPKEFTSAHSNAGVRRVGKGKNRHLAYGNFGWNDLRLKIGFDSSRPGELRLNDQTVLLRNGRVVFWRASEKWADQSNVVAADLPMPSQPKSELGQALTQLRQRIVDRFAPQNADNILAPKEPGTWDLGDGVTLDFEQQEIVGDEEEETLIETRAILRWSATETRPALRHEIDQQTDWWMLAMEKGGRTIWTAGEHDVFRRIDFSDPMSIREDCMNSGFGDMPEGVRAELQSKIRVNKKLDQHGLPYIGGNMGSHGESAALIDEEFFVRGSVIDEQPGWPDRHLPAAPFADVLVEAYTIANPTQPIAKTRSDADGNWELRFRIGADLFEKVSRRLEVRVDLPGYAEQDLMAAGEMIMTLPGEQVEGVDEQANILRPGEEGQATFRMLKAGKISGVLRDGEGNPIPDAFVWVKVDDDEEPWDDEWVARPGVTADSTKTSTKGVFVLSQVPPNRELHIAASLGGGASVQTDAYMMGDDEMVLNVTWDGDTLECAPDDDAQRTKPEKTQAADKEKKQQGPKEEIVLTLNADGELNVDGKKVNEKELVKILNEHVDAFPDQAVIIRASRDTEFGAVIKVVELIKKSGIWNVAFATAQDRPEPADPAEQGKPAEKDKSVTVDGGLQNAWSAEGTVTDIEGRPMEGVEVIVYSGMGSLKRTGIAKSKADGSYRVTFSRGGLMSADGPNLQVAQIGAHFPGYVEKNLNRHGNGAMAMGSDGADSTIVHADFDDDGLLDVVIGNFKLSGKELKNFAVDAESLALPGRPRKLDFVMVPAVRVEGRLVGSGAFSGVLPKVARTMNPDLPRGPYVNHDETPLEGWKVWITGDELPPGSSVWDSAVADKDGRFVFENVPAGFEWHFRTETNIPAHREPVSRRFTLARGEAGRTAEVVLELQADQKKANLEFSKPENDDQAQVPDDRAVDHNVTIEGTAIDAETGEAIQQAVIVQGGLQRGDEIVWGYSEQRSSPSQQNGKFSTVMNLGRGDRARVIADGYLPKPIFDRPPSFAPGVKAHQRGIALRRGRQVSGRVFHHDGKPMVGASVFAVGPVNMNLYDGKAWRASGNEDDIEEPVFRPVKTDQDGRFSGLHLSGTNRVAVSSNWIGVWPAIIADNRDQVEIHLPKPAAIGIDCCIPGGDSWDVQVYYQFLTPYMSGSDLWKSLSSDRTFTIPMGRTDLPGVPPGHYQIMRRKMAQTKSVAYSIAMDREYVYLEPGADHGIDWLYKDKGARVKTTVRWPIDEKLTGLIYRLTSKTSNKDFGDLDVPHVLDGGSIDLETGELYSSTIPAGDYWLSIEAQRPISEERLRFSTPILPDYTKSIEITVPERKGKQFVIDDVAILDE